MVVSVNNGIHTFQHAIQPVWLEELVLQAAEQQDGRAARRQPTREGKETSAESDETRRVGKASSEMSGADMSKEAGQRSTCARFALAAVAAWAVLGGLLIKCGKRTANGAVAEWMGEPLCAVIDSAVAHTTLVMVCLVGGMCLAVCWSASSQKARRAGSIGAFQGRLGSITTIKFGLASTRQLLGDAGVTATALEQGGPLSGKSLTKLEVIVAMHDEKATRSRILERLGQFRGTLAVISLALLAFFLTGDVDFWINVAAGGVATYEGAFFLKDITTRAGRLNDLLLRPSPVSFEGRKGGPISMQRALNLVVEELARSVQGETVHKVFVDDAEVRNPREVQAALAKKEGGPYKVEFMTVGGDVERGRHRIALASGLIKDSNGLKRVFNAFRVDVTRVLKLALLDDGLWKGGAGQSDLNLRSGFGEFCDRNAQRRLQDVGSSSSQEESFYSEKEPFLLRWQAGRASFDEGIQRGTEWALRSQARPAAQEEYS